MVVSCRARCPGESHREVLRRAGRHVGGSRALPTGPGRAFESLSFGDFNPEEAVVKWECLLVGGSFEELVEAGEPRIVAGQDNDGCVAVPHKLRSDPPQGLTRSA